MAEVETYITSQGEIIRKTPVEKDNVIVKEEIISVDVKNETGSVINELWNSAKETAVEVAHIAGMATVIAEEKATQIKDTVLEKAHEVGEKTKELMSSIEHIVEQGTEKAANSYESAKEVAANSYESAKGVIMNTSEVVTEKAQLATEHAGETLEKLTEKVQLAAESATGTLAEKASSVSESVQEAVTAAVEKSQQIGENIATSVQDIATSTKESMSTLMTSEILTATGVDSVHPVKLIEGEGKLPATETPANIHPPTSTQGWNLQDLKLTMDVVSHLQRIADRTGDPVLHDTARKAHSACAKGLNDAPGVHLTWVTPQQANDLVNLAIRTQDHELANFARYCQSVAATSHIAVEPTPGKIHQEIQKGHQELQEQGRVHTGPGYGAAFASVRRSASSSSVNIVPPSLAIPLQKSASFAPMKQPVNQQGTVQQQKQLTLTIDIVSHVQRIADRTGNPVLHETARKAHSACAKGLNEAPGVHLVWITPQRASELMNLASKTLDAELIDFARYCQSVAATTQIGVEPTPGKIQEEITKGRLRLQQQNSATPPPTGQSAQ